MKVKKEAVAGNGDHVEDCARVAAKAHKRGQHNFQPDGGATLREWFAGQALAGMRGIGKMSAAKIARKAAKIADAILVELATSEVRE